MQCVPEAGAFENLATVKATTLGKIKSYKGMRNSVICKYPDPGVIESFSHRNSIYILVHAQCDIRNIMYSSRMEK